MIRFRWLLAILLAIPILSGCGRPSGGLAPDLIPTAAPGTAPPAIPEATPGPPDLSAGECEGGTRPCPDDYDGWLQRLSVPPGFQVNFLAALPEGQTPTAIAYGPDGRLYAAAIPNPFEDPSRMAIGTTGYVTIGLKEGVGVAKGDSSRRHDEHQVQAVQPRFGLVARLCGWPDPSVRP